MSSMKVQEADTTTPESSVIPLAHMSQQAHVWVTEDDWTGVIDQKERRKLQNRQNQRAFRLRRKQNNALLHSSTPSSGSISYLPPFRSSDSQIRQKDKQEVFKCAHAPPGALDFLRWFEATAQQSYLHGSPQVDHLIGLTRLNVYRAINENILAIGMTLEWMREDNSVSIFNLVQPGFAEDCIPPSLRPTLIQRQIPHHPWLDFFPFPQMRDILITAGDGFDDDELCHDLMAFWDTRNTGAILLVWGQSWDPRNWEVTEGFARKWSWLLKGSPDLLASTNYWRVKRGEKPLVWRQVLELQ